ncbi:MAG: hypothetical protein HY885_17030 [Deltaproteobacteria bacterium]|nr:hypothetical protein [Deltaproteobacteria bacterium]
MVAEDEAYIATARVRGYVGHALDHELRQLLGSEPDALLAHIIKDYKREKQVRVSLIDWQGKNYILKHYYVKNFRFRLRRLLLPSLAGQLWRKVSRVRERGIATPALLAAVDNGKRLFYRGTTCLYEYVHPDRDNKTLHGEFADRGRRNEIIAQAASLLRRMHQAGIYHGDAKISNFLWVERSGRVDLHVIDLDDVRFVGQLSSRQRLNDLSNLTFSLAWFQNDPALPGECFQVYSGNDSSWCGDQPGFLRKLRELVDKKLARRRKWQKNHHDVKS